MFFKRRLKRALQYFRYHQKDLNLLLETFELNNYDYAIVGGFLKDVYRIPSNLHIRDIDIIVDLNIDDLERILKHYNFRYSKNSFSGYKIVDRRGTFKLVIDLWTLNTHKPFEELSMHIKKPSWKSIPKSAWLSVDGATWLPSCNKLYAKAMKRSIRKEVLGFYYPETFKKLYLENDYIVIAKILRYYAIDKLELNSACKDVVHWYFTNRVRNYRQLVQLVDYLYDHYGNRINWKELVGKLDRDTGKFLSRN